MAASREFVEGMIRYARTRSGYDSLVAHFEGGAGKAWRESFPQRELAAPEARHWDMYRGVLVVDPREHYSRLDIPVLVVLGEADDRVLIHRHRPAFDALSSGGLDFTLWVVPEASHGLMLGPGNALGYAPGLHERLVEWVLRASGAKGEPEPTPAIASKGVRPRDDGAPGVSERIPQDVGGAGGSWEGLSRMEPDVSDPQPGVPLSGPPRGRPNGKAEREPAMSDHAGWPCSLGELRPHSPITARTCKYSLTRRCHGLRVLMICMIVHTTGPGRRVAYAGS
jgi:hypothetical protein